MDTSESYKNLSDEASPLKPDYIVERVKWYEDPIYIKRCDCEEIQGGRDVTEMDWDWGDYYYGLEYDPPIGLYYPEENFRFLIGHTVWLPRQDQLQEMYRLKGETDLEVLADFSLILLLSPSRGKYYWQFTSMEQLWLAFVMKECYGKVWSGTDWIKEE